MASNHYNSEPCLRTNEFKPYSSLQLTYHKDDILIYRRTGRHGRWREEYA